MELTDQRIYNRFAKNWTDTQGEMVNPRHQIPQRQPVTATETSLPNMLVGNAHVIHVMFSKYVQCGSDINVTKYCGRRIPQNWDMSFAKILAGYQLR